MTRSTSADPPRAAVRRALRTLAASGVVRPALTARQAEVIGLVARGHRTREIASILGISERAVTAHITRLMAIFRVPNRSGLIAAVMAGAGIGIPPRERAGLTRLGAQAHVVSTGDETSQYLDAPFLVAVTTGPDHVFTFVNRLWERVMGHSAAGVLGRCIADVFPDRLPVTWSARQRAYREGRPTVGTDWHYRWTQADGTERESDLKYIFQPLRDVTGEVHGLLLIATEANE